MQGKRHTENRFFILAHRSYGAAMQSDDFLCNRKPQSSTARVGCARFIQAEKFFKNGIQLMRRDGFSLILKINPYFSIILLRPKQNSGTRIAVCDGIFKDIVEYPGQFFRVSKDDYQEPRPGGSGNR